MRIFVPQMTLCLKNIRRFLVRVRRFRNRNGYGIHSPFAYDFVKGVVYEQARYYAYKELKSRRRKRTLAQRGLTSKGDKLMFRVANYCHPHSVVLVGAKSALTAEYIAAGSSNAEVSIYPLPEQMPSRGLEFVFAAQDSDILTVFHITAQCASETTFFAAAGIHDSRESESRWNEICADARAIVTFDLYEVGFVFFNPNLNKQNYIVSF